MGDGTILLRGNMIWYMNSFNYRKIRTMGAVLVAISIPIFTSQLEKARQATDAANARAAYAEASANSLDNDGGAGVSTNGFTIKATDTINYKASGNPVVGGKTMSSYGFAKDKTYYCHITVTNGVEAVTFTESKDK